MVSENKFFGNLCFEHDGHNCSFLSKYERSMGINVYIFIIVKLNGKYKSFSM